MIAIDDPEIKFVQELNKLTKSQSLKWEGIEPLEALFEEGEVKVMYLTEYDNTPIVIYKNIIKKQDYNDINKFFRDSILQRFPQNQFDIIITLQILDKTKLSGYKIKNVPQNILNELYSIILFNATNAQNILSKFNVIGKEFY